MRAILCLLLSVGVVFPAASQPVDRYVTPNCQTTPVIATSNYPGYSSVPTTNRLAQPTGKAVPAPGQQVYVYGRVFDRNCVPVSEAKIDLWQTDPEGRYRFATDAALASAEPVFAGAGRATTDNLGQFRFFTLYPGPYSYTLRRDDGRRYTVKRAPHFNIRVSHPDISTFNSNLFFSGDYRNADDYRFRRLSEGEKPRVLMHVQPRGGDYNAGLQVTIDIVLQGHSQFRTY